MSKHINKPIQSIVVIERGGRVEPVGHLGSCQEAISAFEVGASNAKDAIKIVTAEFGNARRFYVPNFLVNKDSETRERMRPKQRRTNVPHGESKLKRGEIKTLYSNWDYYRNEH